MNTHIYNSYDDIMKIVNNTDENVDNKNFDLQTEDIYHKLMKKEEKILDVLTDIHQQKQENTLHYFMNTPVHLIFQKLISTLRTITSEMYNAKDVMDIINIISKKERLIYTGVIFVIIALIMIIITV
jgi:hypothetical protein|tara:strand:- start:172 stop:552 length:381 start_codon:yes stop_codon:yes gene_type:complete